MIFCDSNDQAHSNVEDLASGKIPIKLKTPIELDANGNILLFKDKISSGCSSGRNSGVWIKKKLRKTN